MKCAARILIIVIFIAVICTGGIFYWAYQDFHNPGHLSTTSRLVIPKGTGLNHIAALLNNAGIIARPEIFIWAARLTGEGRTIKAGEYDFQATTSPREVLTALTSGKTVLRRVTIPEGLSSFEIATLLNQTPALRETVASPAEGSLLPETYSYAFDDTRSELMHRMNISLRDTLRSLWAGRAPSLPFDTPEQALILASIVEKETGIGEERPRVAAVFINRLRKKMRLQSDPTVIYGLTLGEYRLGRALTRKDLEKDTQYNTYRIAALPPGAICNPGKGAIAAVLNPLVSGELYFVADGTGGHVFAKTLAEHNRNVIRWRRLQKKKSTKARSHQK
jgi:UPF0755 protein